MNPTLYKNGRWYKVKNLGWLLRHHDEINKIRYIAYKDIDIAQGMMMACNKTVELIYRIDWASVNVMFNWLDRPRFRGMKFDLLRSHDLSEEQLTIGDVKWKSLKNHPNLHQYCLRQFPLH